MRPLHSRDPLSPSPCFPLCVFLLTCRVLRCLSLEVFLLTCRVHGRNLPSYARAQGGVCTMAVCAGKLISGSVDIRVWNLESLSLERVLQASYELNPKP